MIEREQGEATPNSPISLSSGKGSERWFWKRALQGAKYGFIFGVGLAVASLGASGLLIDVSTDIPGVTRVMAFQIGYFTGIGGLIGGFKPTSEIARNTWRTFSSTFRQKP